MQYTKLNNTSTEPHVLIQEAMRVLKEEEL